MEITEKTTAEDMMRELQLDVSHMNAFLDSAGRLIEEVEAECKKDVFRKVNAAKVLLTEALEERDEIVQSIDKYAEILEEREIEKREASQGARS
jgi:hypothetical protein